MVQHIWSYAHSFALILASDLSHAICLPSVSFSVCLVHTISMCTVSTHLKAVFNGNLPDTGFYKLVCMPRNDAICGKCLLLLPLSPCSRENNVSIQNGLQLIGLALDWMRKMENNWDVCVFVTCAKSPSLINMSCQGCFHFLFFGITIFLYQPHMKQNIAYVISQLRVCFVSLVSFWQWCILTNRQSLQCDAYSEIFSMHLMACYCLCIDFMSA